MIIDAVFKEEEALKADFGVLMRGEKGDKGEPDYSLVAGALKGSASGNPIALSDVSPLPHEIAVSVDVNGATVQKFFGKNYSPVSSNTWTGSWTTLRPTEPLKAGKKYLLIADVTTTSSDGVVTVYDGGNGKYSYWKAGENSSYILSVGAKDCDLIWIHAQRGYVANSTNVATLNRFVIVEEQEPEPLTADKEGNISIVGNGESMTLIAEDGVTISAEYNKDTNKVINDIYQKLSALGVAVVNN